MSAAVTAPAAAVGHERLILADRSSVRSRALALAPWLLLAVFLAAELAVCAMQLNGPFLDEGIYLAAGLRTLQGHGIGDGYLTWFSGSLMWPVIAAFGWKLLGLAGARAAAAICVTAGLAGMLKATGNLLGMRVRAATALAAVISGPVIALAHLAVYDALAVAFVGGAFWAMTEFLRRDHRGWLAAAALLYALAGLAKYPALMFAGPPLAALVVVERGRRARLDLGLAAFIVCAVLLVYFLSDRAQLAAFEAFRTQNNPNFHVGRNQIVYSQIYFTAVPLLLALVGTAVIENRRLALALLTGLIGAPVYHLITGNPSGDQKHVVFGLLFILPLIGVTISHALYRWRSAVAVPVLVALGMFGLVQATRIDEGWGDLRGSVEVLTRDVRPGEKLLVSSSWVEAAYLYDRGRIASPNDVYDVYRVQHLGKPFNVCEFDWFIEVPGGEPWPPAIRRAVQRCGFRKVYESSATLTGLGSNLRFVTYRAPIEIWERRRGGAARAPLTHPVKTTDGRSR